MAISVCRTKVFLCDSLTSHSAQRECLHPARHRNLLGQLEPRKLSHLVEHYKQALPGRLPACLLFRPRSRVPRELCDRQCQEPIQTRVRLHFSLPRLATCLLVMQLVRQILGHLHLTSSLRHSPLRSMPTTRISEQFDPIKSRPSYLRKRSHLRDSANPP